MVIENEYEIETVASRGGTLKLSFTCRNENRNQRMLLEWSWGRMSPRMSMLCHIHLSLFLIELFLPSFLRRIRLPFFLCILDDDRNKAGFFHYSVFSVMVIIFFSFPVSCSWLVTSPLFCFESYSREVIAVSASSIFFQATNVLKLTVPLSLTPAWNSSLFRREPKRVNKNNPRFLKQEAIDRNSFLRKEGWKNWLEWTSVPSSRECEWNRVVYCLLIIHSRFLFIYF